MTTKELPKLLNKAASDHYLKLNESISDKTILTYVWISGDLECPGGKLCAKIKIVDGKPKSISEIPPWYDSKYNKEHIAVEYTLQPVQIFRDPFFLGDNKIVLCDTYFPGENGEISGPLDSNKRPLCVELSKRSEGSEPWFGIEQEYTLLDLDGRPLGWPSNGFPNPGEVFYFNGVGHERAIGRQVSEAHLMACLYSGIKICGTTVEAMPSQWEYQIGPLPPVEVCDQLIISRFLLKRVAEDFGVIITFDPKPVKDWSGSSCHTNFSTKEMRANGGLTEMQKALSKLEITHKKHLIEYDLNKGEDNKRRMLGTHCAPSEEFLGGCTKNNCSVRIPKACFDQKKGYMEDRRPASNCNPYRVVNSILKTVILDE